MFIQFVIIILSIIIFLNASLSFAATYPTLLSPPNASTTSSNPILIWEPINDTNQYRIIIDDDPNLIIPYIKNYYTTNTQYSPQLNPGKYYWKITAKNSNGIWGEWSSVWSFDLTQGSSILTSTPSPTDQSSPLSLTPIDSPTPTKTEVVFTISSTPSSINSSKSFITNIEIKGSDENSNYYLKGAFLKDGSSNYFGKTKVQNNWIKNNQTYSAQFPITTDSSGNWSGNLEVMADPEDSGFTGSGDYLFKVGRYNDSGLGPIWSNVLNINIDKDISNDFNLTNPANSPSPIASKTKTVFTAKDISQNSATSTVKPKIPQSLRVNSSSVAGVSVENDQQPKIKNEEKPNFFLIIGIFLFLSGIGVLFLYYKKYWKLRKGI